MAELNEKRSFDPSPSDDAIIKQAKARFGRCEEWERPQRQLSVDDIRFFNADSDNKWQWEEAIQRYRELDRKPCLTVNKTRQHCLQIINDAKQNKPSVTVRPVGNGATYEAAQVYEGIIRHVEYISNATDAYDTATEFQVMGGVGYWRVTTDYVPGETFNQDIFIRRIKDPFTVYLDPDINEADGSDAKFGFIFDDMPRELFAAQYPKYIDEASNEVLGNSQDGWIDDDHVRVAEYYRVADIKDKIFVLTDPQGKQIVARKSVVGEEIYEAAKADPSFKERDVTDHQVEYYLIAGNKIIEKNIWPGQYVPIVRVIGEETVIQGILERKGHVRALKDPQRIYNFWTSEAVQQVALQSKIPYKAPVEAIEGYETYWENANTTNSAILPYNAIRDDGTPIPMPVREEPPVMASAYIQGMQIAAQEMQYVSGQYEAQMGAPGNERTGKAINERQRQGDTATYHYIDNLGKAIRFTGKIIIDLIPHVYDTPRVLRILGDDGTESYVNMDPQAKQAYAAQQQKNGQDVQAIFNPNVGSYDVMSDIGPNYATKRQEAFNAFSQIVSANPQLVMVVGDLLFKNADFPGADEIAERLQRMVPIQAKQDGPPPEMLHMSQQMQGMQDMLKKTLEELAVERNKSKAKDQQKEIDVYEAITERIKVFLNAQAEAHGHFLSPKDVGNMVHDLNMQERGSQLNVVESSATADIEDQSNDGQEAPQSNP